MQTFTVRDCRYLKQEESLPDYCFNISNPIERFQNYIETSDWDQKLISYSGTLDKVCLYAVIFLAGVCFPFLLNVL